MDVRTTLIDFESLENAMNKDTARLGEAVSQAASEVAPEDPTARAALLAAWNTALGQLRDENKGPGVLSSSENALASRVQSYLTEQAIRADAKVVTLADGSQEVKFDNLDVFPWIYTGLKGIFQTHPHAFVRPPENAERIGDKVRIALFSDWATGLYGAPVIRDSILHDPKGYQVVLHLGDTYYSGSKKEVQQRLLGVWPLLDQCTHLSLNGNHEMYSGGHAYFEVALPFFKQKSSCVAFQNTHWLLVGLDTAISDFNLDEKKHHQVSWLKGLLKKAGKRKLILFSHHQPWSQLDKQGLSLQKALKDLLVEGRIYAWFWGHEHRCVVYAPHTTWGLKGRCVGHGGFPAFRDKFPNSKTDDHQWQKLPATEQSPSAEVLDGINPYVKSKLFEYSPHGYVALEFSGATSWETYHLPDGKVVRARQAL